MRARRTREEGSLPHSLPDDLFDYADDPAPRSARSRRSTLPDSADNAALTVIDDWPDFVPVTEAEIDIFERYFGDALDRLFCPIDAKHENDGLRSLTKDVNNKP